MAKITGHYNAKDFEDDVDFNLWENEEADEWSFDGSTLTGQENNVTELPNPSKWEYAGSNLKINFVKGIPVISGGTITDIRIFRNKKLDGSGSWVQEFSLSNAQIDAVDFYNAFNNVDPTDNDILWKKMLSGDDTFILSDNPDGNYVRSYAGNDHITGSTGNDIIDGGAGADTMRGGAGNDTYMVDNVRDVVTEGLNAGTDTVQSSITYTLGANVENLILTRRRAINGTGNTLNNVLTGNSGNNILNGGAGADTLTGGAGADTFRFALADSRLASLDRITDFAIGTDRIDGPRAVSAANLRELGRVTALTQAGISAVLTSSTFARNGAATFSFGTGPSTRTFLALNDGTAGFSSTSDGLIEITRFTGLLTNLSII